MRSSCGAILAAASCFLSVTHASVQPDTSRLQTAVVATASDTFYGMYSYDPLGPGQWGRDLPKEASPLQGTLVKLSPDVANGCQLAPLLSNAAFQESVATAKASNAPFILLVERGNCTFTDKALVAQSAGASAVVIADTAEAIYNTTVNASKYGKLGAFDCTQGQAILSSVASPPWSDLNNDPSCATAPSCTSKRCIPTGSGNQVCCMWDVADYMGAGNGYDKVTIPVVRVRALDSPKLQGTLSLSKRFIPRVDLAQVLIWLMAIATITTAGYMGSALERKKATIKRVHTVAVSGVVAVPAAVHAQLQQEQMEEPALDMGWQHAVGFLIFGSAFLLVLYYVNVVIVVIVFFCFGASSATNTIIFTPLFHAIAPLRHQLARFYNDYIGDVRITVADIVSFLVSTGLAIFWVLTRHQDYSWVLQDVFGVCVCLLFLQTIRLSNIKVATILLILVFFYDIFFVFLSPYIFGKSVMIVAAQGGKQDDSTAPASYCLRYPLDTDAKCIKEAIPILLRLPKITNWVGGEAMLGLGDIVLPGLLLVFCARYDYATRGNLVGTPPRPSPAAYTGKVGLFVLMVIGYAVGLFLANLGVILMQSGQPALLYLVPCTLGVLSLVTWRAGLLKKLWDGPTEFDQLPPMVESDETPTSAILYTKAGDNDTPMLQRV
ncbi:Aste57867_17048 [Aphanomyces stellatus]|uniref:Aste57867_17048 protein n=1 Tax=Aphanomyces stellatus TaxID=120398 RepID=A0A485L6Z1_9STRA|nr:hypothetical protein As57867_016990 [Aphanomyces stellatus]VFT93809.1 Aste57867_17048 [Aphanomyces stellatus]